VERLTAGNILIRRAITAASGQGPVRFDPSFGTSGGEDTRFCAEVRRRGGQIRWSAEALTYEVVPAERCTVDWLAQRWRRTGATMVMVGTSLAADPRTRWYVRARGALTGMARIVRSLDPRARSDAARAEMTRHRMMGLGQIEGALGRRPLAYGPQGFETANSAP
jgi:succinoglycan biosynthesis protein ExoM